MSRKVLKRIKIITVCCVLLLCLELIYVGYAVFFHRTESLYFDGINALEKNDQYYVTVGSNNDNTQHYEKAKISMYNQKREKTLERLYNVGFNSSFFGVGFDNDSVIAVGSYEKDEEEHEDLVRRGLIVKYDFDGNIIFEKDFQLLANSKFTSVFITEDGYYVTGQSVYKNTQVGSENGGAILVKYNKDGKLLWSKTYGSSKSAIFNDLLITNHTIFAVGTDEDHVGIICKYDLDGNLLSYNDYKYTDDLGFSGIIAANDRIYISGANREVGMVTNAMIVEYDFDCAYIKEVVYENKGTIRYNKLIIDEDNYIVAIGNLSTRKNSHSKTADTLNYDGIIGKYDLDLKEISVVTYGEDRDDFFTDIQLDNGNYLVVGYSSYEDGSYLSKYIHYSDALKVLGVDS